MHEHGKVAAREGGLAVRDRVERDIGIGDDPLAVALRDGAVFLDPFGLKPAHAHARSGGADLVLRLQRNALRLQAAVIDPRIDIEFGKALVDMIGPALAPLLDQLGLVPLAHLRAEPVFADFAHGEHDMGVGLGLAVRANIPMDIEVGDHALFDELGLGKLARQLDALFLGQLARNGEFDLAGKLRVLALLGGLDRIPELFAVGKFLRRAFRQHHFGMDDPVLVGEVMVAVEPFVVQPLGSAIGCGGHGAAPARPADDFDGEVEDRHDGNPSTP
jgi:hypothetical protein